MRSLRVGLLLTLTVATAATVAEVSPTALGQPGNDRGQPTTATTTAWATFDDALPAGAEALRLNVERHATAAEAAAGAGFAKLVLTQPQTHVAYFTVPVPAGVSLATLQGFSGHFRATATEPVRLRWLAIDARKAPLFQRRFVLEPGAEWRRIEWRFEDWRWGRLLGSWAEVRAISLCVESAVEAVWIDEWHLIHGERGHRSARPAEGWAERLAFGDAETVSLAASAVRVTAPSVPGVSADALRPILDRAEKIPAFLDRVFGEAVRPIDDAKISMLVFADADEYRRFFERLGRYWDVGIAPPMAGGYAVQDLATSSLRPGEPLDRPVFFHETVHAMVAQRLRLMPGRVGHDWLQEGLANYLQLALFPHSFDRAEYVRHFSRAIDPAGRTFFKPLRPLLTNAVTLQHYAQLASLTAFLIDQRPAWLPVIARGLADGAALEAVLAQCEDTTFETLEREWWAWGQREFSPTAAPPAGPNSHFRIPREWAR